ncbi:MAG: hypothetical protein E7397_06605 [Ruminococcaceae bacterium]|nr:hypothetical protein [Oscillospiraceae bacterium]
MPVSRADRKEGRFMKHKLLSGILAASCAFSVFGGLSVQAADVVAQSMPYYNDFEDSNFSLSGENGFYYNHETTTCTNTASRHEAHYNQPLHNGQVAIVDGKLTLQDSQWNGGQCYPNNMNELEFVFRGGNSGIVVVELDYKVSGASTALTEGMILLKNSSGANIAGWSSDGRGAGAAVVNGSFSSTHVNNGSWMPGTYSLRLEVDLDNKKWSVSGSKIKNGKMEFNCNNADEVSKLVVGFTRNGDAIDNLKVYKKITATQTEKRYDLWVGDEQQAGISYVPANAVIPDMVWKSADTTVATVDGNGLISALAVGSTAVTATSEIYGVNFTYEVNVNRRAGSITIDNEIADVCVGETLELTYSVPEGTSAGAVTWSSSNDGIARVDENGLVTAVGKGTATITVTGLDGAISATFVVNIIIPLTELTVTAPVSDLKVGETVALQSAYAPQNASVSNMKWRSGNHYVATVDENGVVKAVGNGTTKIYLTCANLYASTEITVTGEKTEKKSSFVTFAKVGNSFSDIADMAWAQSAIQSVVAEGFMIPDSEKEFGAKRNVKRDEFVSVVIRTLGLQDTTAKEPVEKSFEDVAEENPYYAEITKAVELGIIEGVSETSFNPDADITRQDMAVVVCKALEAADIDTVEGRLDFADKDTIAEYAQKSVRILSKMNVITGKQGGIYDPLANTTRAETAVISDKITALR